MAVRDMIVIDEEKCNGCGLCVPACAEGALQIIDGKARLLRDDFCDGLGACLGHCPQGALSIEKREAPEFDEEAAMAHARRLASQQPAPQQPAQESGVHMGCPGARMMELTPASCACWTKGEEGREAVEEIPSALTQWPVELALLSPSAPYLQDADLLLCADCVPIAYANFHQRLLQRRKVAVACPKLDDSTEYITKLATILVKNNLKRLTIAHMEVPCCSGLLAIANRAMEMAGKRVPIHQFMIGIDGTIKKEEQVA
ncbi:MAG: 4Fe-4S binding protein [Firmicutes bacterium]|nr:4Fe-4S binding protein [Bacillota bacterium]